jgi:uncharacterized protein YcfL
MKSIYLLATIFFIFSGCDSSDAKKVANDTQAEIDKVVDKYKGNQPIIVDDNEPIVDVEGDKKELLAIHNSQRADVGVTRELTWSNELQVKAQEYADTLASSGKFEHDPNNKTGDFKTSMGENLYASSSSSVTFKEAAQAWANEKSDYTYGNIGDDSTCQSGKMCGHYTQMIWQYTTRIGCAKSLYKKGKFSGGYAIVCKYKSAGNVGGYKPY